MLNTEYKWNEKQQIVVGGKGIRTENLNTIFFFFKGSLAYF